MSSDEPFLDDFDFDDGLSDMLHAITLDNALETDPGIPLELFPRNSVRCALCGAFLIKFTDVNGSGATLLPRDCKELWEERGKDVMRRVMCKGDVENSPHIACVKNLRDSLRVHSSDAALARLKQHIDRFQCFVPESVDAFLEAPSRPAHEDCVDRLSCFLAVLRPQYVMRLHRIHFKLSCGSGLCCAEVIPMRLKAGLGLAQFQSAQWYRQLPQLQLSQLQ